MSPLVIKGPKICYQLAMLLAMTIGSLHCLAQGGSISGRILDAKSHEPLSFANVFLNNTTIGSVSNTNGEFILRNINQNGTYELVISFVGYESLKIKLTLSKDDINIGDLEMKQSELELDALEVKGSRDKQWEKKFKKFTKIFLGDDKASEACTILNPWVIDFPDVKGLNKFKAIADSSIEIENKALGYKISFYLSDFQSDGKGYVIVGNAHFNELKTNEENERIKWESNRQLSYMRSRHHLFKAIIDHRIRSEGFFLYTDQPGFERYNLRTPYFNEELEKSVMPFDTANMVTPLQKDVYRILLKGRLEAHYHRERALIRTYRDIAYPVSWITANRGFILVNKDGYELNPEEVTISGAMSTDRVARMLPMNYRPNWIPQVDLEISLGHLQENIYTHTDKPYYYPGEAMWFKGYINYGTPLWRDSLSRTLYVEFISSQKKIILSKTIKIDSGLFHGNFILPDSLTSGDYYLRSYTNFNRNLGDSSLYSKTIPILSITEKVKSIQLEPRESNDNGFEIISSKVNYKPREKITLTIKLKNDEDRPMASNLSVSITDVAQVAPVQCSATILEGFPLKEFNSKSNAYTLPYPIEQGISFSGRFLNKEDKPSKALLTVLQLNPRNALLTQSNENGIFSVGGFDFYDTANFSIQATNQKGQVYGRVELVQRQVPFSTLNQNVHNLEIVNAGTVQRLISEYEAPGDSRLLEEVVIKAQKIIDDKNFRTYGRSDYVISGKDINSAYGNLLYTLPGKFPGLIVRQASDQGGGVRWVVYSSRPSSIGRFGSGEVLVTINDVPVSGNGPGSYPADILATIDPSTVESIGFTSRINVLYGSQGQGGVLSIYTKTGPADHKAISAKNYQIIKVIGFAKSGKFRSPDYDDQKTDSSKADYRSTLYWNPIVKTSANAGTATISFFASDLTGRYRVEIEGVTSDGKPVRTEQYISVENDK